MGIAIVIWIGIIIAISIICLTVYKVSINNEKNNLTREVNYLSQKLDWLENTWEDVCELKMQIQEILNKLKEK